MSILDPPASPSAIASSSAAAGKSYRLGRIFAGDGRTLVLPVEHGTMLGTVAGLEDPVALIRCFLPLPCDGFLLGPRVAARTAPLFATRAAPSRVLTIDTYCKGDAGRHVLMTSVERARALGVDAVKMLMPWDVPPEERAARSEVIGEVIVAAEPLGLPVMVEPICLSSPRPADAVAIEADGCRMAAELGADIIKVMYPDDPNVLSAWCSELGVPLVILGGPDGGTAEELCAMVEQAIAAGARGITVGRCVWQRPIDEATELLTQLAGVVHADEAAAI
jgi:class I fructose-bisphosphate aldolase